jgi:hypothetical protein
VNSLNRRLSRLECSLLTPPETWATKQLRQRMESARQRVAAVYGEQYLNRAEFVPNLTVVERLQAGRMRAHLRSVREAIE